MTKYKIVANPISGRGNGERHIPDIEGAFRKSGLEFSLVRTEYPGHAVKLTQQAVAEGYDYVIASGGDGTVNEVINGLMLAKKAGLAKAGMGVITVGRGNDFAFSMGVPGGWEACCELIAKGVKREIDIGLVTGGDFPEGRYFGNGVGIGFDAVVGFIAVKLKPLSGFASYIVAALETIFLYYKAPLVRIELDEADVITQPSLMVSIMNGRRLGGGFMLAPNGLADDNKFDLNIVEQASKFQNLLLMLRYIQGKQAGHPKIKLCQANKVVVTALEGVLPAHADGETLCLEGSRLVVEILPRQIELISVLPEKVL
jgi:YegS/Rv2252/BmrU family lipid kinase